MTINSNAGKLFAAVVAGAAAASDIKAADIYRSEPSLKDGGTAEVIQTGGSYVGVSVGYGEVTGQTQVRTIEDDFNKCGCHTGHKVTYTETGVKIEGVAVNLEAGRTVYQNGALQVTTGGFATAVVDDKGNAVETFGFDVTGRLQLTRGVSVYAGLGIAGDHANIAGSTTNSRVNCGCGAYELFNVKKFDVDSTGFGPAIKAGIDFTTWHDPLSGKGWKVGFEYRHFQHEVAKGLISINIFELMAELYLEAPGSLDDQINKLGLGYGSSR
jgi:hypothetical protein